jgi:hypothetical protein
MIAMPRGPPIDAVPQRAQLRSFLTDEEGDYTP